MAADPISGNGQKGKPDHRWLWLFIPFVLLVLVTVVFTRYDLDRMISGWFYSPGSGWFLGRKPLWYWLYKYGTVPGIIFSLVCLLTWLGSYYLPRLKHWRKPCLVVVLTTVLAAGLLVNAVLKQYWGRPRPSQTIEYGGQWEYRPIFPPGAPGKGASFPCGHCTMGFVFLATASFYRRSKALAIGGVATGMILGVLLSLARIVQGAHFANDTIWSFGIVGLVALGLTLYLPEFAEAGKTKWSTRQRFWITVGTLVLVVFMAIGFLTRRPYFSSKVYPLNLSGIQTIEILMVPEPERIAVQYAGQATGRLQVDAHGFGWLKVDYKQSLAPRTVGDDLQLQVTIAANSYFAELDHALTLTLPETSRGQVNILLNQKNIRP